MGVIVVTGSLNMDFVVSTGHLPAPGETVLGQDFRMIPGGKGGNQACAAGRLNRYGTVRMVGRTGRDIFADQLRSSLMEAGVDVTGVTAALNEPTGVALIEVDRRGQNTIVVASGANFAVTADEVESSRAHYRGAECALFQLETPLPAVEAALRIARIEGAVTILDPAPAQPLRRELLELVDILTPNESEACMLLGRQAARIGIGDAREVGQAVLALGAKAVILKLGEAGCFYVDSSRELYSAAFKVEALDSTAAGDVFNAGLAVALTEGQELPVALRFASAAAAISVTRAGAQASIPSRDEVEKLLADTKDRPEVV
ncbi:MAG: ribokinase [Bryobacteraceae bacterium]|nr:ribokinase [Bryobacteraceae bacterium]